MYTGDINEIHILTVDTDGDLMSDQRIRLFEDEHLILGGYGVGGVSDGYHTFDELYHHRAVLFASLCSVAAANPGTKAKPWKSRLHHDGTMYDNMFIVGMETPYGQATYHYDVAPYWDMFPVTELERAPEWDGHTPADAIERIYKTFNNIKCEGDQ